LWLVVHSLFSRPQIKPCPFLLLAFGFGALPFSYRHNRFFSVHLPLLLLARIWKLRNPSPGGHARSSLFPCTFFPFLDRSSNHVWADFFVAGFFLGFEVHFSLFPHFLSFHLATMIFIIPHLASFLSFFFLEIARGLARFLQ